MSILDITSILTQPIACMETATIESPEIQPIHSALIPTPAKRFVNWPAIRDAFIKRTERPSYDDLATEFGIKAGSISNTSSDEGWPILRAQHISAQLEKAGASEIIIQALAADKALSQRGASFGMQALESLSETLNHPKMKLYSPSTKCDVEQTCTLAFLNIARGLKELGITGISKTLDQAGKEGNGQWNPQLLQQINVNVGEIIAKAKSEVAASIPAQTPTN